MSIPDYQRFMLPLLKLFAGGKEKVSDCLPDLKEMLQISDEEALELLPSGKKTVLSDRAHWARTYLSKAGLLETPKRGYHQLTKLGHKVLSDAPAEINNEFLAQFPSFIEWKQGNPKSKNEGHDAEPQAGSAHSLSTNDFSDKTPEQAMMSASKVLEEALRDELLEILYKLDPFKFEVLIVDLLIAMGFGKGQSKSGLLTPKTNDGGFDGVIHEDTLGLDAVYIQAKRYAPGNKVGSPEVQQFIGSLSGEGATKGVFVTTSDFSENAKEYIKTVQQRVILIGGQRLAKLMIDHEIGVRTRTTYSVKSIDEDYFSQEQA